MPSRRTLCYQALAWLAIGAGATYAIAHKTKKQLQTDSSTSDLLLTNDQIRQILQSMTIDTYLALHNLAQTINPADNYQEEAQNGSLGDSKDLELQSALVDMIKLKEQAALKAQGVEDIQAFVAECRERAAEDVEIATILESIKVMIFDAFSGRLPLLPDYTLDPAISNDIVLEIIAAIHRLQREEMENIMSSYIRQHGLEECQSWLPNDDGSVSQSTPEDLSMSLRKAMQQVQSDYLQRSAEKIGSPENFHHALALLSRDTDYASQWKTLKQLHHFEVIDILRNLRKYGPPTATKEKSASPEPSAFVYKTP